MQLLKMAHRALGAQKNCNSYKSRHIEKVQERQGTNIFEL